MVGGSNSESLLGGPEKIVNDLKEVQQAFCLFVESLGCAAGVPVGKNRALFKNCGVEATGSVGQVYNLPGASVPGRLQTCPTL
jgi:hypothetical protein